MNITRLKNSAEYRAFKYINERRGWRTNRRIIVIESDDWGSIRMPNRDVYEKSLRQGIRVDNCPFCKYDTLASKDDLDALYSTLRKHKDANDNSPVITANTIVANPNFSKIASDNFENYYFELFTETITSYPNHSFTMWEEGIREQLFFPQLHGREHLNIERWLSLLKSGSQEINFAFSNNYFGISSTISKENNPSIMAALDYDNVAGRKLGNDAIKQGARIFKDIFGFYSKSFIGPNYFWHEDTSRILSSNGVKFLQGMQVQRLPNNNKIHHYLGEKNSYGQTHLIRNVVFEPSTNDRINWVDHTLAQIKKSFSLSKPAIISMHRLNFIGSIFEFNRTNNLKQLDNLLTQIVKTWPNVEFMTSEQLGTTIERELISK